MTARDIQRRLIEDTYRENWVIANYTPANWFEMDVMCVTNAGFVREFEIKVSRGDFFADMKKIREVHGYNSGPKLDVTGQVVGRTFERFVKQSYKKHDLLADPVRALNAKFNVPTQFWFVVPEGMLKREEVPSWAGLIEARIYHGKTYLTWDNERPAPRLHENKVCPKVKAHAVGVCYWRMHKYFLKNEKASK